jgi:hypothetical protein
MARTNSYFLHFVFGPSTDSGGRFECIWGIILSITLLKMPPNRKPIATGVHGVNSCFVKSSNVGESKDL